MTGLLGHGTVVHAGVRSPKGRFYDVRGCVREVDIGEPFGIPEVRCTFKPVTEEDLQIIQPIHEHAIAMARKLAEALFPELPWESTQETKILRFLEELEDVSRRHGLWVRSPYPAARPVLEPTGEGEHYVAQRTADGFGFIFERKLE
jgi:hypothetical protein